MNIYFAGSIRGGRSLQAVYQALVAHMQQGGHAVLSEAVAFKPLGDEGFTDEEIYRQDTGYLDACDCVVAEVTVPSLGVGYEIGYALHEIRRPVLCLCQQGTSLSAMLAGNPRLRVAYYTDAAQALSLIDEFLSQVQEAQA